MKILVFDDNETHQAAAKAQLKDHDLTVVSTYDEAQELLMSRMDRDKRNAILWDQFGDFDYYKCTDKNKRAAYREAEEAAEEQATTYPDFDAVLVDLFVPVSSQELGAKGKQYIGQKMPVGVFIALLAAKNRVKYVALVSDTSHHDHPAAACLDAFGFKKAKTFSVNSCKMYCSSSGWLGQYYDTDLSERLRVTSSNDVKKIVWAKDWAGVLDYVVNR